MIDIVYEDNHLLIAVKPPNMLAQSDVTGDESLQDRLKRYVKEKYHKPGEVYLGLVHRMDRPVGGLMAFARTSKAASRLSEQLRSHQMEREYLTVVEGADIPDSGLLKDYLLKDVQTGNVKAVPEGTTGAQEARLTYTTLKRDGDTALLHVRLETGRKHQIRVQLMHSGHPIRYDMRYGRGERGHSIALWGAVLRIEHPTRKEPMIFKAAPMGAAYEPFLTEIAAFLSAQ